MFFYNHRTLGSMFETQRGSVNKLASSAIFILLEIKNFAGTNQLRRNGAEVFGATETLLCLSKQIQNSSINLSLLIKNNSFLFKVSKIRISNAEQG